jgi:hypothetical protein
MCVCNLRYSPCNAHAQFCHLWLPPLCNISPHYLTNVMIFEKKNLLKIKCVLILSTTFIWNISHSKKRWSKMYIGLYENCPLFLPDCIDLEIFSKDIGKTLVYTVSCKSFKWEPAELFHADGQTDRHGKASFSSSSIGTTTLVGFRSAQLSLSILSRKVLQSAVTRGMSNPQLGGELGI